MTELNMPLLAKTMDWFEEQVAKPDFRDSEWAQNNWHIEGADIGRICGTAYCIAGYVAHVTGAEFIDEMTVRAEADDDPDYIYSYGTTQIRFRAQRLLGLDREEAYDLFHGSNTAEDIRRIVANILSAHGEEL